MNNHYGFLPSAGTCKKDFRNTMNTQYENYVNSRNTNETNSEINSEINSNSINSNEETTNTNTSIKDKYSKEEFLEEFSLLHNDLYFDPYKILEIDKDYDLVQFKKQYKKMAMESHPDRGGDSDMFKEITQAYIYLLKKYKENIPDKQIFELKEEFENFTISEGKLKNTLLNNDNFNINQFNDVFNQTQIIDENNNGYSDFLKKDINTNVEQKNKYVFSDNFNIEVFNKIFNNSVKKPKDNTKVTVYKEPKTLFQSSSGYSEIGSNSIDDFSSDFSFNRKLHFMDCKKAYSESDFDASSVQMESFNNINELEKHRANIKHNMSDEEMKEYEEYIARKNLKEIQRKKRVQKQDLNILKNYKKINQVLLEQ